MSKDDERYDPRPKAEEFVRVMHMPAMRKQCIDDEEGGKCGEGEVEGGDGDMIHDHLAGIEIKRLDAPGKAQRVVEKGRNHFRRHQSEDEDRDRDKEIVMAKKIVNLKDQEAENLEMTTNKLIRRRLIY